MRASATPLLVNNADDLAQSSLVLEPAPLKAGPNGSLYDEHWLQLLIQTHPSVLPMAQIEPALWPLIPTAMELQLPSGFADNLLMTPQGGIVLVEAKLWRNPQARREVVGQVLDYAKDMARLTYEDLQQAVRKARADRSLNLFELVCGPDRDPHEESRFVDAVSRNLRLGRFALIIAGDGIQESAEQLGDFLQRHLGLHFTLAMVEMSVWRVPGSTQLLIHPRVLTRTVQIERAVIRLEEGMSLSAVSLQPVAARAGKSTSISEETFYEALAKVDAALPQRLKAFIAELEPLGVYGEVRNNLSIKWRAGDGRTFNLGLIDLSGRLASDYPQWSAYSIGRLDLGAPYQDALARLIPGGSVRKTPKEHSWRVVIGDQNPPASLLLDRHQQWAAIITDYIASLEQALQEDAKQEPEHSRPIPALARPSPAPKNGAARRRGRGEILKVSVPSNTDDGLIRPQIALKRRRRAV